MIVAVEVESKKKTKFTVTGIVVGKDGEGLKKVKLSLMNEEGKKVDKDKTGGDGEFKFKKISAGSYVLKGIHKKEGEAEINFTITTKDGCFDQFHALAKEELAFTRGSEGCISIHTSSSKDTNTLKFAEVWESEDHFNTYFAKRVERSGEDFASLLEGPPEKECFQTDDWGYGKEWQK